MSARVLIVVTHLLGTGHLSRALTLARAYVAAGHEAHILSGGLPAAQLDRAGIHLHQLPPLRIEGTDFTNLLTQDGTVADAIFHENRQADALALLQRLSPDVVITELFPFGRRALRAEFTTLLSAAHNMTPRPRIFASIRDVLAPPSNPAKAVWAEELIHRFYDGVLVHSDPDLIPLERSWPVSASLAPKLRYTGFVAPPAPDALSSLGAGEVLVSAGGGAVGSALFSTALKCAARDSRSWRLLVGGHDSERRIAALRDAAPRNVVLETPRADFREMLRNAAASVSLCGYNTALDVLQAGTPAVFVPFDAGGEVEQGLRADSLAALPGICVVKNVDLSTDTLRAALVDVGRAARRTTTDLDLQGAENTVQITLEGKS